MADSGAGTHRFLCDYVDGASDRGCSEQRGATPAHHFHAVNHRGWDLLQTIHARKRREHWSGIDEDL